MKELYIEEYERIVGDLIEKGHSETDAERLAKTRAYAAMTDRLADAADRAYEAWKEGL